jgi:hypothetical protein
VKVTVAWPTPVGAAFTFVGAPGAEATFVPIIISTPFPSGDLVFVKTKTVLSASIKPLGNDEDDEGEFEDLVTTTTPSLEMDKVPVSLCDDPPPL